MLPPYAVRDLAQPREALVGIGTEGGDSHDSPEAQARLLGHEGREGRDLLGVGPPPP